MSFTPIVVTGQYYGQDNVTPAAGKVTFTLSAAMQDTSSHRIIEPQTMTATLSGGAFSITLPANDDSTTSPSGVVYNVVEQITGSPSRSYAVSISHSAAGGTVDLSTLAPATTSNPQFSYLLVSTAQATYGTSELGYQERTSTFTTTNTAYGSAASNKIGGLSVPIVGQGLPVKVEFFCDSVFHGTAGVLVSSVLIVNGAVTGGQLASESDGKSLTMLRRLVLTNGVSYTFEVGTYIGATGTGTFSAFGDGPMHLSVNR